MRPKRVKLKLSPVDYHLLCAAAADQGISVEDCLRRAVSFAQYVERLRLEGGRLIVERPDGSWHEVVGPTGGMRVQRPLFTDGDDDETDSDLDEDEIVDATVVEPTDSV